MTAPIVTVQDVNGNTVTSDNATVISAAISGGGALVGTSTRTVTSGVVTFTNLGATGVNGTSYTLTFAATSLASDAQSITVSTGPAAALAISTQPAGGVYGTALTTQPVVRVVDTGGNSVSVSGRTVTAAIASGAGSLAGSSVLTNGNGVATFTGLAVTGTPGAFTLTFAASGLASVTSTPFNVDKASQAQLTMTSPSSATFGQTITLSATGGSGTGAVSYAVAGGSCAVLGTTLTPGDAGSLCQVQATKATDTNYLAESSSVQTIAIAKADQVVAFTSTVPTTPLPGGTYTPTAESTSTVTGSATSVAPTLSVTAGSSAVCSMTAGVVTFNITGSCVVEAVAGSDTNYNSSTTVQQTIAVGQNNQTITFNQPANVTFGDASYALGASASSGLPVSYSLGGGTTNAACSVSTLGVVTVLAVGTCEVVASQAGSGAFAAASDVSRAFQVLPAVPTAPSISSASASDQSITVSYSAPGFTGGASITAYEVVATPVGFGSAVSTNACSPSAVPLACTISGLTNGTTYTVTVAAINAAGTGPRSSATGQLTPATAANAVSALTAVPGNSVLDVYWNALTNPQLGGGTFTQYEVAYRVSGTSHWTLFTNALTNQTDHSTSITGLANSVAYDVQVVAITSANATPIAGNTATVAEYPSTTPDAPQDVSVLATTATTVQVSWAAPLTDGGAPLTTPYYAVAVTSTSPGAATPVGCTFVQVGNRFCTVTGLTNGAVYSVRVTAQNRMGVGDAGTTSYTVPSDDATLSNLVVNAGANAVNLSPAFAPGTLTYAANVENDVDAVTLTPTTSTGGASATVNGVIVVSGESSAPIALSVGANAITVVVTAADPSYSSTYVVAITRAAAPPPPEPPAPTPTPTPNWNTDPQTPPTQVTNGQSIGGATVNGDAVGVNVKFVPKKGKAIVDGTGFTFVARAFAPDGSVEQSASTKQLTVPQGGWIVVAGDGYAANARVAVYAIPDTSTRSADMSSVKLLGTATTDAGGRLDNRIMLDETFNVGNYVLQTNGELADGAIRSVNIAMKVTQTEYMLQRSAFYRAKSLEFSTNGIGKLNSLVTDVPKWATNVKVTIVGVSVSLASGAENVQLAWKRGRTVSRALLDRGLHAKYTISTYITFERSVVAKTLKPVKNSDGKPLTTVNITYRAP